MASAFRRKRSDFRLSRKPHVTMPNIVSVSWPDHLSFGEADGVLDTPDKVVRRMHVWREELGASMLHWRIMRARIPGRFSAARGYRHTSQTAAGVATWDDFELVPAMARDAGLESWLYVSLFDEGWPLAPSQSTRGELPQRHARAARGMAERADARPS